MITVKNKLDSTDIYITGDIEDDKWKWPDWEDENTYPADIRDLLKDAKDNIDVYINSGGGDMFAGVAISNMLKRFEGKTTAHVDGVAASAASIIAFGCDEIIMPSNAYLMIHKPSSYAFGNADELEKMADTLNTLQKGLVETYMVLAKDGVTENEINDLINAESWFTGKDASDYFNIQVIEAKEIKNAKVGMVYNKANIPEELEIKEKNTIDTPILNENAEIERKNKEIEIALSL